ncbi:hypothetical protein PAPYR_11617 [Paratrimastix pyriformis]|uniref:Secreted protein n=1 Tax=Paratrimastix pyriformis TaxID=342808 RepID=A0ABQ8U3C8_9EUKA|nr:hypothetical protein PAPYR_11617 [Paratrimastix pyriformis]
MLVVSLLAMSQTLRSHSSTCDSEIRTITGHARNSFRAQVLLKPVFHLGLIDLVAREGEYSERSESLLNNRPVVLWVCTWHLHVALFIPWPFFVPEGKPPTSNLSLRQNAWLRPSSRGRVVAEPMLSRGKAGGAHVPAAQLAGFYNNAHCELLPLQHTLAVAREELHLFWARTRGAANSPVSDRRHDDSEGSIVCSTCLGHHPARDRVSMTFPLGGEGPDLTDVPKRRRRVLGNGPHCRVLYFDHAHQGCPPLVTGVCIWPGDWLPLCKM